MNHYAQSPQEATNHKKTNITASASDKSSALDVTDLTSRVAYARNPAPRDILEAMAEESGVSLALLLCVRRDRKIARPRQLAMYLMRKLCFELSLARIGASVGGRDHKTVMHACDLMDYLLTRDRDLQNLQIRVLNRLYANGA